MIINAKDLELSYDNKKSIIQGGNFVVNEKDFVFIGGASGSGKSTLLKSLYAKILPTNGKLIVDTNNINRLSSKKLRSLRKDIGIIFQDYKLLPRRTVYENVAFALHVMHVPVKKIKEQVHYALELVGLTGKASHYPKELSGGEQQKICIARAIVNQPSILLCDEPTGNLDPETSDHVFGILMELVKSTGMSALIATHNLDLASRMDRHVVLGKGKIT